MKMGGTVFTVRYAAAALGIGTALVEELATGMRDKDGLVSVIDTDDEDDASTIAFTPLGLDMLAEILANNRTQ